MISFFSPDDKRLISNLHKGLIFPPEDWVPIVGEVALTYIPYTGTYTEVLITSIETRSYNGKTYHLINNIDPMWFLPPIPHNDFSYGI